MATFDSWRFALCAGLLMTATAQPPGGGGGGPPGGGGGAGGGGAGSSSSSGATSCTTSATTCASDGSQVTRSLVYNTSTGIFTGFIVTNQCTDSSSGFLYNGASVGLSVTPSCSNQTFPAPAYMTTPAASSLRGRTGLSLGGSNIYGPFDAGFTTGQACTVSAGTCAAGTDVYMCERLLEYTCGTANMKTGMMMDDCGGHASPYHYHCHGKCWATASSGHSPLVGIMLDGRGLYGMNETTGVMPADLDACGGHYGPVPARTIGGVTYPAASNVYHYHVQSEPPYFGGCYGPVTSMAQAKSLYPTCTTSAVNINVCTAAGMYNNYTLDCPIFRMGNQSANQVTVTSSCPVCTGNCVGTWNATSASISPSPSASIMMSASPSRTAAASSSALVSPSGSSSPSRSVGASSDVSSTSTATSSDNPSSSALVSPSGSSSPSRSVGTSSNASSLATTSATITSSSSIVATASMSSSQSASRSAGSSSTSTLSPSSSRVASSVASTLPSQSRMPRPSATSTVSARPITAWTMPRVIMPVLNTSDCSAANVLHFMSHAAPVIANVTAMGAQLAALSPGTLSASSGLSATAAVAYLAAASTYVNDTLNAIANSFRTQLATCGGRAVATKTSVAVSMAGLTVATANSPGVFCVLRRYIANTTNVPLSSVSITRITNGTTGAVFLVSRNAPGNAGACPPARSTNSSGGRRLQAAGSVSISSDVEVSVPVTALAQGDPNAVAAVSSQLAAASSVGAVIAAAFDSSSDSGSAGLSALVNDLTTVTGLPVQVQSASVAAPEVAANVDTTVPVPPAAGSGSSNNTPAIVGGVVGGVVGLAILAGVAVMFMRARTPQPMASAAPARAKGVVPTGTSPLFSHDHPTRAGFSATQSGASV